MRVRRRNAPACSVPRRRGTGLAGDGQSGVSVAGLDRGLALEHARGTRKPLGHSTGRCGAGRGIIADMGGSAAVEKRRGAWPGHLGCTTGPKTRRKGSRGSRRAHLSSGVSSEGSQRRRRRSSAAAMAWWSRTGLTRGCSGLLGSTGSFVEFLR